MATNLCAECGTRLPRVEYKTHMQEVHGVAMADSDTEHHDEAPAGGAPAIEAAVGTPAPDAAPAPTGDTPADAPAPMAPKFIGTAGERSGRGRRSQRSPNAGADHGEFACGHCDRSFATQQGLSRHVLAKHADVEGVTEAAAAAAAAAATAQPGMRRGGRGPRGEAATTAADGNADAANGDGAAAARRRPRSRRSRGTDRSAAAAHAAATGEGAAAPTDAEVAATATAAAAAAAALSSSPGGGAAPAAPKPERLVTLFRCKQCDQGFKSKNRARAHVTEAHPDTAAAAEAPAADGAPAADEGQEDGASPADLQLEVVQVAARRAPRSQGRRGRKPAAADKLAEAPGAADGADADGLQAPRPATGVRRGGRPPKGHLKTAAGAPTEDASAAETTAVVDADGAPAKAADELAALGIVSTS